MNQKRFLLLLALAAACLVGSARAQIVTDVFVNFKQTSSGQANGGAGGIDLSIDVGDLSQLTGSSVLTFDIGTQLSAVFGSDWNSTSGAGATLSWSAAAVTPSGTNMSLFATTRDATKATKGSWSNLSTALSNVQGLASTLNTVDLSTLPTFNQTIVDADGNVVSGAGAYLASAIPSGNGTLPTYTSMGSSYGIASAQLGNGVSAESASMGITSLTMEEWTGMNNGAPTTKGTIATVGTWSLDTTDGILTYTPTAAPEPSDYGLMAVAAGFFFLVYRLRTARSR